MGDGEYDAASNSFVPTPKRNAAESAPPGHLLRYFSADCHATNQHWWHNPATGERLERNLDELLCLVVSEVSEALEGERKDLQDTHLPKRKMAEVELADVLIRIFDIAGAYNVDLDTFVASTLGQTAIHDTTFNGLAKLCFAYIGGPLNRGQGLMKIVRQLALPGQLADALAGAVFYTLVYAGQHGYDLDGAVAEKRAYNANRADHKAAARLAPNGKKF